MIETNDGLPYIGDTAPQQFAATGFGGNGMTFGTLAGIMARDAAQGKQIRKLLKDALAKGIMEQRQFRIPAGETTRPIMHFKKRDQ